MTYLHQLVFEIQDKITESWNIGHTGIYINILRTLFVLDETTIQGMTFLYQIVFEM